MTSGTPRRAARAGSGTRTTRPSLGRSPRAPGIPPRDAAGAGPRTPAISSGAGMPRSRSGPPEYPARVPDEKFTAHLPAVLGATVATVGATLGTSYLGWGGTLAGVV